MGDEFLDFVNLFICLEKTLLKILVFEKLISKKWSLLLKILRRFKLFTLSIISLWICYCLLLVPNQLLGIITHFQEKIFLHKYDFISGDYDFKQSCRPTHLFFRLTSFQYLDFVNYAHTIYLPIITLRLRLQTANGFLNFHVFI